jgi:hypothetical protein
MITTAFVMAVLVTAGFVVLFYKLPVWLRRILSRRYIILDIILCILIFWTLGFALIGIMAAGFISLFVSAYLLWYKKTAPKVPIKVKTKTYTCKSHTHWAARCYNWWKQRRA